MSPLGLSGIASPKAALLGASCLLRLVLSSTSATRQLGGNEFLGRRAVAGVRHVARNVIGG
jgi:hypothetical protein